MATLQLHGFEELDRRFKGLSLVAQRQVLIKALKPAGEIVKEEAASRAPRGDSGELAGGMTTKISGDTDITSGGIFVGPGKAEFYGYFKEFGTGASFDAAAARAMGFPGLGSRKRKRKPDNKPTPFLGPALQAKRDEALNTMATVLDIEIKKAASL